MRNCLVEFIGCRKGNMAICIWKGEVHRFLSKLCSKFHSQRQSIIERPTVNALAFVDLREDASEPATPHPQSEPEKTHESGVDDVPHVAPCCLPPLQPPPSWWPPTSHKRQCQVMLWLGFAPPAMTGYNLRRLDWELPRFLSCWIGALLGLRQCRTQKRAKRKCVSLPIAQGLVVVPSDERSARPFYYERMDGG